MQIHHPTCRRWRPPSPQSPETPVAAKVFSGLGYGNTLHASSEMIRNWFATSNLLLSIRPGTHDQLGVLTIQAPWHAPHSPTDQIEASGENNLKSNTGPVSIITSTKGTNFQTISNNV